METRILCKPQRHRKKRLTTTAKNLPPITRKSHPRNGSSKCLPVSPLCRCPVSELGTDTRSGIVSDPNREDDEQYIVRLVGKVVTVSVETVKLVMELAQAVTQKDWINKVE